MRPLTERIANRINYLRVHAQYSFSAVAAEIALEYREHFNFTPVSDRIDSFGRRNIGGAIGRQLCDAAMGLLNETPAQWVNKD